ncbi:MAG TPA: hypothetical protein VFF65_00830 [Phycisphaerales bacterium]|nr:hypothetical protein [Phycisphaerales bacterium]
MSTTAAQARLKDGLRELNLAWRRAQEQWRDQAAAEFHKDVIEPLEPKVSQALNAMATLGEAIQAANREVE